MMMKVIELFFDMQEVWIFEENLFLAKKRKQSLILSEKNTIF